MALLLSALRTTTGDAANRRDDQVPEAADDELDEPAQAGEQSVQQALQEGGDRLLESNDAEQHMGQEEQKPQGDAELSDLVDNHGVLQVDIIVYHTFLFLSSLH